MIRVGPAGWSYADWAGIVYPKPKPKGFDELQYLAGYFDSIEINTTFYRPATDRTAQRWVERVDINRSFRFTAKLWKRFTHERKTAWSRDDVKEARAGLDLLRDGGRLGAVLLQFPWSFRNDEANRAWLEDVITAFPDLPLVVEVRHASWAEPSFFADLRVRGVGFVNIDQPQFSDSIAPSAVGTAGVGYIRVHGRNYREWWRKSDSPHARYDYLYTPAELKPWVDRAREIAADLETSDVYVVTNNHFQGKAVVNAFMIESMLRGSRVAAPPPLLEEYGEELRNFARGARPEGAEEGALSRTVNPVQRGG